MENLTVNISGSSAISGVLIEEINQLCAEVESNTTINMVLFNFDADSTKGLCSSVENVDVLHKWEKVLRRVENLNALIIAICNGQSGLAALSLIAIADLRLGTPTSTFALNGKDITLPGMLIHRLTNQMTANWVRSLLVLGNTLCAEEALACGLLDRTSTQPKALAEDFVAGMNPHAFNDIRVRRKLMLEASHTSHEDTIGLSLSASDRTLRRG
ncbi:enoyl-CoA hydratase-related protein [Pantoea allii]|uniref:enoyl-CoA hydratase-related protein n=1 Tax=Pantoea allii TaxID=574096 RepID=UPI0024B6FC88|nr:enoyl-CoA hydratase-related protein [Pantoea allii]MDJ0088482.1 enoyl-CoA hydratase-related protein [Pantoea allii]